MSNIQVYLKDLNLSKNEEKVFVEMVGSRYNVGKQEVKLTTNRFPNRIENKRYITFLLENLVRESKRICKGIEDGSLSV